LTAQLLAFGRKQMIELQVVDLSSLVARTSRMLRRTIREDVEVVVKRPPEASHVRVDVSQIEQVVMNLALNAQDALPDGGHMVIETGNVIVGTGARRCAGPGARGLRGAQRLGHGRGHGRRDPLAPLRAVLHHEGEGQGNGTRAGHGLRNRQAARRRDHGLQRAGPWLDLPRLPPAHGRGPAETERALRPRTLQQGAETVLVVEDNPLVRNLASNMLEAYGYTVLRATSGEECLRQVEEHGDTIHLLLADVIMPG